MARRERVGRGLGPSASARSSFVDKENQLLAFAQDDGILKQHAWVRLCSARRIFKSTRARSARATQRHRLRVEGGYHCTRCPAQTGDGLRLPGKGLAWGELEEYCKMAGSPDALLSH